jgi:hypothetical protein
MSRMDEITNELLYLYAGLQKTASMTEEERAIFDQRVAEVIADVETDYGIPALSPEVPAETQRLFFALQKFVAES